MLTAAYHMLKNGVVYEDLGELHFVTSDKNRQANRLVKRLADLGFSAQLSPLAA